MTDNEKLSCLIDRPCTACKFHKEEGCSKWSCVFEEKSGVPEREKGIENYDKLMTINQQLAFENEELRERLSAVPERKKGRWVYSEACSIAFPMYRCSNCGKISGNYTDNFCSRCGADMREG